MDAFCRWVKICLIDLNIPAELLEVQVGRVCEAMKILYVIHCYRGNKYSRIDPAGLMRRTMTPKKMPQLRYDQLHAPGTFKIGVRVIKLT
jgi:hypothetical protein